MRAVIQRVKKASLSIDGKLYSKINKGLLVLLAISEDDTNDDLEYLIKKTIGLRVFEDENDKMNLSINDIDGEIMVVSQFTLYGDVRKGNRPNFMKSAKQDKAIKMYEDFIFQIKDKVKKVESGLFGADMEISIINYGPVTIQLDSKKLY